MAAILGLCLFFLSLAGPLRAEEAAQRDMRLTDAVGRVTIRTADNPKKPVVLDEETPLLPEDVIEIGPHSRAEIVIDRETVFSLQANTRLKIKKLFLKNTQLELSEGQMLAKVKPANGPDEGLILKMPTAVVAIRRTEFGAGSRHGVSFVGVFDEGQVVVAGAWGHEHLILRPNQETYVTLSNVPRPVHTLSHFKADRKQISVLRTRAAYWRKNWKPLSVERNQNIRHRLADPQRKAALLFRHPEQKPSAHVTKKKRVNAKKKGGSSRSSGHRPSRPPA